MEITDGQVKVAIFKVNTNDEYCQKLTSWLLYSFNRKKETKMMRNCFADFGNVKVRRKVKHIKTSSAYFICGVADGTMYLVIVITVVVFMARCSI